MPPTKSGFIDPGPIEFDAMLKYDGWTCSVPFRYDLKEKYGKGNLVPVKVTWDGSVVYRGSIARIGREFPVLPCRKSELELRGKGAGTPSMSGWNWTSGRAWWSWMTSRRPRWRSIPRRLPSGKRCQTRTGRSS